MEDNIFNIKTKQSFIKFLNKYANILSIMLFTTSEAKDLNRQFRELAKTKNKVMFGILDTDEVNLDPEFTQNIPYILGYKMKQIVIEIHIQNEESIMELDKKIDEILDTKKQIKNILTKSKTKIEDQINTRVIETNKKEREKQLIEMSKNKIACFVEILKKIEMLMKEQEKI